MACAVNPEQPQQETTTANPHERTPCARVLRKAFSKVCAFLGEPRDAHPSYSEEIGGQRPSFGQRQCIYQCGPPTWMVKDVQMSGAAIESTLWHLGIGKRNRQPAETRVLQS